MKKRSINERILVADGEPKSIRYVREVLKLSGFEVLAASRGEQVIEIIVLEQPDMLLCEISLLGDMDGFTVVERLREFSDIPIIMLTSQKEIGDVLRGFEIGIDDYITKPFNSKELLARIRAVFNRSRGQVSAQSDIKINCGDLQIDLLKHQVTVNDQYVHLTPTEYKLLHELALHPNRVLVHEHLLTVVWGPEYRNEYDYLRSYIHMLRRKIEPDPTNPCMILRVLGVGYMLVTDEDLLSMNTPNNE